MPSALAVSGLVILMWTTLFWITVRAIKRDPKWPFKLVLIGFASLLILASPLVLYLVITIFALIDFK